MNTATNNTGSELSLLNGAVFARVAADRHVVGGITLLDVAVGLTGKAPLATFEVTIYRGRVAPRQVTGGTVPAAVHAALVAALETRPDVAEWR